MIDYDYQHPRSSLSITLSVWYALLLREAVTRLSSSRAAWVWLILEPLAHVCFMLFIFTVIRMRTVSGIDTAAWLMVGLIFYFLFKRTGTQTQNALSANKALFGYRQVKPVDTILVRAILEGLLLVVVGTVLVFGSLLFQVDIVPDDPLIVLVAFFGLWFMGLGYGLMTSVLITLIPVSSKILGLVMRPVYMTSGAILPISHVPEPFRGWLLYNPIAHGLEAARSGMSSYYHTVPGLDIGYLYFCALFSIFFGLALHKRYAMKLVAR
jgi:capsular polysaccharide transport system permease protein